MHAVIVDPRCGGYLCNFAQIGIPVLRERRRAVSQRRPRTTDKNDEENQPQPSGREIAPCRLCDHRGSAPTSASTKNTKQSPKHRGPLYQVTSMRSYAPMRIRDREWMKPKMFRSQTTTPITTTAFKMDLIDPAIGMKLLTSQSRTPTAIKTTKI